MQTAWDRLPQAWERVTGKLPDSFHWSQLAGSTDYAVVKQLVETQFPAIDEIAKGKLIHTIIFEMDRYYLEQAPINIRLALYPDTSRSMQLLHDQGWIFGIITGNSTTVANHKLQAAGLLPYVTSSSNLLFFGENIPTELKC